MVLRSFQKFTQPEVLRPEDLRPPAASETHSAPFEYLPVPSEALPVLSEAIPSPSEALPAQLGAISAPSEPLRPCLMPSLFLERLLSPMGQLPNHCQFVINLTLKI